MLDFSFDDSHPRETMTLSAKVAQQEKEADALYASLYPADGAPAAEPSAVVETPPVVAAVVPSVADTPPVVEPAQPHVPELAPASEETWERRFKVLQGKYHAEGSRDRQSIAALRDRVKSLETATPTSTPVLVTEEEVEKYGQPFIDMVQRAADQKMGPERAAHTAEIAELRAAVAALQDRADLTSNTSFNDKLTQIAPDWRTVDANPDWLEWLKEYDPVARTTRQVLINDAGAAGDAQYVADAIKRWKDQRKPTERPAPPVPVVRSLEELAQPTGSAVAETPPAAAHQWTNAEVDKFYKDVRDGKYNDAEQSRIEQEILDQSRRRPK